MKRIPGKIRPCGTSLCCLLILVASALPTACSDASILQTPDLPTNTATEPGDRAAEVTITYLANEGFLIAASEKSVLVDALFGDGLAGYPAVPAPVREVLEGGDGPFGAVDCVLATHAHADHFGAGAVARFLHRVPAQFISTREAVADVESLLADYDGPSPRWLLPKRHETETVDCGGVSVSAMSFHHGRLMVKNLAFLVALDGFTILHVGDTEITAEEIRPWGLADLGIDVALLPAWHLTEPSWRPVIDEIGARHVVAMHLASADAPASWFGSAGSLENRIAEIRRQVPTAWVPTTAMEARVFGAAE